MSRPRRNIKFNDYLISEIQEWLNLDATIVELQKRYYDPELSEYIEGQNNCANRVIENLGKMLNLKGTPDIEQVEYEYDFYAVKPRFKNSPDNCVKPEYRKDE